MKKVLAVGKITTKRALGFPDIRVKETVCDTITHYESLTPEDTHLDVWEYEDIDHG